MNVTEGSNEERQVAELAQRIQALENELAGARAQLVGVHSHLLFNRQFFYADGATESTLRSTPVSVCSRRAELPESAPVVTIEPLPIQHPLRRKWSLGKGLPDSADAAAEHHLFFTEDCIPCGQLRMFGLLSDGEVWEHFVPFSQLVQEGGIVIGRDASSADFILPETGVSRRHARIELVATGLVISDLNSTNGLLVNDQVVNGYSPRVSLADGSIIRLGDTSIRIEIVYGSAEPSSPDSLL